MAEHFQDSDRWVLPDGVKCERKPIPENVRRDIKILMAKNGSTEAYRAHWRIIAEMLKAAREAQGG